MENDPYDYPRCEICRYCQGPNKCTHPGPVKMAYPDMKPAGNYDSYCIDGYEKDEESLRRVHELAASVSYKAA